MSDLSAGGKILRINTADKQLRKNRMSTGKHQSLRINTVEKQMRKKRMSTGKHQSLRINRKAY